MRTIQGYKDHILMDEESEIITAVKVTPANAEDGDQLIDLITQFKNAMVHYQQKLLQIKGIGLVRTFASYMRTKLLDISV
ncbi:hypothetical protein GCM10020331_007260 [Ectobacillus funiculus]